MRYFLSAVLALLAPAVASAVPICTTTPGQNSLTTYIALGSSGCSVGDYVFSNFSYNYSFNNNLPAYILADGGAPEGGNYGYVPDTAVTVTPSVVGSGVVNLEIGNASWLVNGWQLSSLTIGFDVSMLANNLKSISDTFTGSGGGEGSAAFFGSVAPPNVAANILSGAVGTYTYPTLPSSYPVHVTLKTDLASGTSPFCDTAPGGLCDGQHEDALGDYYFGALANNFAHLSDINVRFSETTDFNPPPPASSAPEPGTWLTAAAGLALAGLVKRQRRSIA